MAAPQEEDAAAWVNAVLAEAAADGGTVDSRIASVSLKLQTMSADLHADVDADMRALLAAAPRAVGEIEDLQAALQRVQDELAAVDARVARAVRNATEAATLEELDRLREHLEAVGATLVEAASWQAASRAAADALGAFLADRGAADWAPAAGGVAEKLEKMERAEKVLRTLPEPDARRAAVDRVREDLERALAPRLEAVLRAGEADELPGLYALYERLGLGDAFRRTYAEARPFAARNVWFAGDGGGALAPRLAAFLDALLAEAIAERAACERWATADRAAEVAARVARAACAPLAPSLAEALRAAAAASLDDCAACADACERFVVDLARGLGLDAGGALVLDAGHALVDAFAVFAAPAPAAPGAQTTTLYGALEGAALARAAAADAAACRDAGADTDSDAAAFRATVAAARRCAARAGGVGDAALRRCAALTGGAAARDCAAAVRAARVASCRGLARLFADCREALVPAASGLPRDPSLLSDCWAHAREAVYALDVAGVLARDARAWPDAAQRAFDAWRADGADAPPAAAGLAPPPPLPPVARRAARRAGAGAAAAPPRVVAESPFARVAVDRALDAVAAEACALAFECAFAPVRRALRAYSATRAAPDPPGATTYCRPVAWAAGAAAAPPPPPTDVATFVGEHLMSALRHLEPFLESPAAQTASLLRLEALGRLTDQREWAGVAAAPGLDAGDRRALVALGGAVADEDGGAAPAPADADAATRFCAAWLAVLVRATAAAVVDEALRVRALDAGGFAQLAADAAYLLNVARALNAPRPAALARLAAIAAAAAAGDASNPLGGPPGSVESLLAKIEAVLVAKGSAADEEEWEVVPAAAGEVAPADVPADVPAAAGAE